MLFPRSKLSSPDEEEELGNAIEPVRSFPRTSRNDKKGKVRREEGMVPEK